MPEVLPNNGLSSTLALTIQSADTVIQIQSADAAKWPASGNYRAVLWGDPASGPWELVTIVSGQGTANLGVQRAAEAYNGDQTAKIWPAGTGIAAVITQASVNAVIAVQRLTMAHQEFVPVAAATTVSLSSTPEAVLVVAREGVVQSQAAGHYSIATNVLTFAAAFTGSERVIVSYSVRG